MSVEELSLPGIMDFSLPRPFAPGSKSQRERKFQGAKVPGCESSRERNCAYLELSLPGRMVLGAKGPVTCIANGSGTFHSSVFSLLGAKVPQERKFPGTFAPGNESSRELSHVPGNFRSRDSQFAIFSDKYSLLMITLIPRRRKTIHVCY